MRALRSCRSRVLFFFLIVSTCTWKKKEKKKTTSPVTVLALYEFIFLQPKQTASFSQHGRHFRLQFKHGYSTQTSRTPTCQKTIKVSQTHTHNFKKKTKKNHTLTHTAAPTTMELVLQLRAIDTVGGS